MLTKESLLLLGKYLISNQIKAGPVKGFVRRYRSTFRKGAPYPEITGYAASSFSKLYDLEKDEVYLTCAVKAADALIRYQKPNGSIPTVIAINGEFDHIAHIFDLAIIARGILDVYERVGEAVYLKSAKSIVKFIEKSYLENNYPSVVNLDGECIESEFPKLFWINTKIIIPLYQLYQITGDKSLLKSAEKIHTTLLGSFDQRGFFSSNTNPAYNRSHYQAYAIYGITYLHRWTKEDKYIDIITKGVDFLRSLLSEEGGMYSEFSKNGAPKYSKGYDVPVSAQLAELIIYLNSVGVTNEDDAQTLRKIEGFLHGRMVKSTWNKNIEGGLPFLEKGRLLKYTVPWGVEFSIHYMHDKKYLTIKR
jgi:hypothetical protein